MDKHLTTVKNYLLELNYEIKSEDPEEAILIVENEDAGIKNLILDCEETILVVELLLFELKADNLDIFKQLLQKNRDIIHGAFALDESGKRLLYRDTLQLENLDLNELQGTLYALEMLLSEYGNELINFSKN